MHGGNAANNVSVRSPNAKDVGTNDNLNTGDGIANYENDMGLDFARSTRDGSMSISRNTSGSNVNDFDPNCVVFLMLKTSPKLIEKIVGTKREDFFKKSGLMISNGWHIIGKSKSFLQSLCRFSYRIREETKLISK